MALIRWMNERIKLFTIFDVKLVQLAAICFALIIVKLFPQIMELNVWWFILLAIFSAIRPIYVMFLK